MAQTTIGWFITERSSPDRVGVLVFEHADGVDAVATARRAIAEFLKTPEGQAAQRNVNGDFNWGDAIEHESVLAAAGLKLVAQFMSDVVVNLDELL